MYDTQIYGLMLLYINLYEIVVSDKQEKKRRKAATTTTEYNMKHTAYCASFIHDDTYIVSFSFRS